MKTPRHKRHPEESTGAWTRMYRPVSLFLFVAFAATGVVFLVLPEGVVALFNSLSRYLDMAESPHQVGRFYTLLAVGYMYLVTVLALLMYRHPGNRSFLFLLINGKAVTSILSFAFFAFHGPYLIYLTNGAIDGLIALVMIAFYLRMKKDRA